jgi:hypothetical protein
MGFILGAKPADHAYLFEMARLSPSRCTHAIKTPDGYTHEFEYVNDLPLNETHDDLRVNFLHYRQTDKKGKSTTWSWVTSIHLTENSVFQVMRGGRARWRIENETFNTLKNQGYEFEHNFGHGYRHLSTNFAQLMMLAFAVDQIQEWCCRLYQAARTKLSTKRAFFEMIRVIIQLPIFNFSNFTDILAFMCDPGGSLSLVNSS